MDILSGEALTRYKDKLEVVGLSDCPYRSQHYTFGVIEKSISD